MNDLNSLKKYFTSLSADFKVEDLFSGSGFYKDNSLFGLYFKGSFCLYAKDDLARYLTQELGAVACISREIYPTLPLINYYILPANIMQNKELLLDLIDQSVNQSKIKCSI